MHVSILLIMTFLIMPSAELVLSVVMLSPLLMIASISFDHDSRVIVLIK